MSAAHTPSPWRTVEREVLEDGSVYPAHVVGGDRDLVIFYLEGSEVAKLAAEGNPHFQRSARNEADSQLVVAAPDMLDALRDLVALVEKVCPEYFESTVCANAVAAIRKATTAIEPNSVGTPQGVNQK